MKFTKLIWKNILRNKRRTVLTVSSLVISLFLIITLVTVLTELARFRDNANPLRLVTRNAVSLGFPMPIAYKDRIAAVPGVKMASPYVWYGGNYGDDKFSFANFAVDEKLIRPYLPELIMTDPEWDAFAKDRQGAIIGQKLIPTYKFKIGQRIRLKSPIYQNELEFIIRGIYTGGDEKSLYFHYDYLNESAPPFLKDKAGTFGIVAKSVDDVPTISRAVDAMFINTDAPSKTETEREFAMSFEAMMGGVKQFMYGIVAAIAFSLLLVMGNAMAMSVRERTKEVGTLKALGFRRGTIAWLFVGEAFILASVGAILGIALSVALYSAIDLSIFIPNFSEFKPARETLVAVFAGAIMVGLISVSYSAFRISGLTIAEALRRVE